MKRPDTIKVGQLWALKTRLEALVTSIDNERATLTYIKTGQETSRHVTHLMTSDNWQFVRNYKEDNITNILAEIDEL